MLLLSSRLLIVLAENRPPTPEQMEAMRGLVRSEMEEGALGVGSSLNYAPAVYASTEELNELCGVAAKYDGKWVVLFLMSVENVRKQIALPWMSFGSDAASMAPEGVFLKSSAHPRAYGNFARLLGRYVREEKVIPLAEAVHRLSGLPATNLGLDHRGFLKKGMFADVVVFDPETIADRATYPNPHQYSVGVRHVLVNGVVVLKDGEHTGALPGRALHGPGRVPPRP